MEAASLLVSLPDALVSLVYGYLPVHFKLLICSHLNHSLAACLTPSCFQFDHLYLSSQLLNSLFVSPRLSARLSSVSSLSVESEGAIDKSLLSLISRPPQTGVISHPLSPISGSTLFPHLTFYSQRVDGIGFHPSSLSSFAALQQLYVDTRRYDASIVIQFSPTLSHLHSLKLHALLSVAHLEAIYGLPALTSLDLAGCTVLGGDIALHNMPLVSLLEPPSATVAIGRLRTLLCPLGEQRVIDIVSLVRAQNESAVLEYLRCDDSPLSDRCIVDLLAVPSLTALEIHSHNMRWDQPPFAALASSSSPPSSTTLKRLRFVADHDLRDPPQLPRAVIGAMTLFLARFNHLHVLDFTLPSSIALTDVLSQLLHLSALRRLSLSRNKSGAGVRVEDNPLVYAGMLQHSRAAFPYLHTFTCHRLVHLDEDVLMAVLSHMPALRVLQVSESAWVGSGALLASSAFCPELRSITLMACSKFMLEDEYWRRSEQHVLQLNTALSSYRPDRLSTLSLPKLRFLSLQVFSAAVGSFSFQRLVELLAASPLRYFGLVMRTAAGSLSATTGSNTLLSPSLVCMLEPLPLIGLAIPTPPLLRYPPVTVRSLPHCEYSREWVESEESKARRERSVLTVERLTDVVESDGQLLYDWMTRHRFLQLEHYAHVFISDMWRAQYFADVRQDVEYQRKIEMANASNGRSIEWVNGKPMRSVGRDDLEDSVGDDCCCMIVCHALQAMCQGLYSMCGFLVQCCSCADCDWDCDCGCQCDCDCDD